MKRIILVFLLLVVSCSKNNGDDNVDNGENPVQLKTVQERLDKGESPLEIFNDLNKIDSLYGKFYAGGVIFHFNTSNGTGMVVMKNGHLTSIWGPNTTINTSTSIGSGESNTEAIINFYNDYPDLQKLTGAYACANLELNGYSDWFMPSKDEMKKVADILFNEEHLNDIGIGSNRYWTSSSIDHENAWCIGTSTTNAEEFPKNGVYSEFGIKAVRKF